MKTIKRKKHFPLWANYIVRHFDGEEWFYQELPKITEASYWTSTESFGELQFYKQSKPPKKIKTKIWKLID